MHYTLFTTGSTSATTTGDIYYPVPTVRQEPDEPKMSPEEKWLRGRIKEICKLAPKP